MENPPSRFRGQYLNCGSAKLDNEDDIKLIISTSDKNHYSTQHYSEVVAHFIPAINKLPERWKLKNKQEHLEYFVDDVKKPLLLEGTCVKKKVEVLGPDGIDIKWIGSTKQILSEKQSIHASVSSTSASGSLKDAELFLSDISKYEIMSWVVARQTYVCDEYPKLLLTRDAIFYPISKDYYLYALKSEEIDSQQLMEALNEFKGYRLAPSKAVYGLSLLQPDLYNNFKNISESHVIKKPDFPMTWNVAPPLLYGELDAKKYVTESEKNDYYKAVKNFEAATSEEFKDLFE